MLTLIKVIIGDKATGKPADVNAVIQKVDEMCNDNGWTYSGSILSVPEKKGLKEVSAGFEIRKHK